jgi:hypothetical protein
MDLCQRDVAKPALVKTDSGGRRRAGAAELVA